MNICMYACMYVLYAYIRVCMHLCVYACMYICMHVCIHVCIYVMFKLDFEGYGGYGTHNSSISTTTWRPPLTCFSLGPTVTAIRGFFEPTLGIWVFPRC